MYMQGVETVSMSVSEERVHAVIHFSRDAAAY